MIILRKSQYYIPYKGGGPPRSFGKKAKMQLTERVKNCNGCEACVVGCRNGRVKMVRDEKGIKYPRVDENGCLKCNNCILYCPLYNPVELPEFKEFYEDSESFYHRDMAKIYRETMRRLKGGETAEFIGTLCQIAALRSLMGDKLSGRLKIFPLVCDPENPRRPECKECRFYGRYLQLI